MLQRSEVKKLSSNDSSSSDEDDPYGRKLKWTTVPKHIREERVEKEFPVGPMISNTEGYIAGKGWQRTTRTVPNSSELGRFMVAYRNRLDGATLVIYIDESSGDGRINGVYTDSVQSYAPSWISFEHVDRTTLSQGDMHSYPQKQGIGGVLIHEGARYAQSQGYKKVKTSTINKNSAALANVIEGTHPTTTTTVSTPLLNPDTVEATGCGCCFLVTACAQARGLSSDCEELSVLRGFRDGYLMEADARREMVGLYYQVAPRIVDAIWASRDPAREFESIYGAIKACVTLIKDQDFEGALRFYREMVETLAGRFLSIDG